MPVISTLELPGSPREVPSYAATTLWWDCSAEILAGETISLPVVTVQQYDPNFADNVLDYKDVTATVLVGGGATIGTGVHANMVQVSFLANMLTVGYEYRCQMSCTGSLATTPARFFRVRVRI